MGSGGTGGGGTGGPRKGEFFGTSVVAPESHGNSDSRQAGGKPSAVTPDPRVDSGGKQAWGRSDSAASPESYGNDIGKQTGKRSDSAASPESFVDNTVSAAAPDPLGNRSGKQAWGRSDSAASPESSGNNDGKLAGRRSDPAAAPASYGNNNDKQAWGRSDSGASPESNGNDDGKHSAIPALAVPQGPTGSSQGAPSNDASGGTDTVTDPERAGAEGGKDKGRGDDRAGGPSLLPADPTPGFGANPTPGYAASPEGGAAAPHAISLGEVAELSGLKQSEPHSSGSDDANGGSHDDVEGHSAHTESGTPGAHNGVQGFSPPSLGPSRAGEHVPDVEGRSPPALEPGRAGEGSEEGPPSSPPHAVPTIPLSEMEEAPPVAPTAQGPPPVPFFTEGGERGAAAGPSATVGERPSESPPSPPRGNEGGPGIGKGSDEPGEGDASSGHGGALNFGPPYISAKTPPPPTPPPYAPRWRRPPAPSPHSAFAPPLPVPPGSPDIVPVSEMSGLEGTAAGDPSRVPAAPSGYPPPQIVMLFPPPSLQRPGVTDLGPLKGPGTRSPVSPPPGVPREPPSVAGQTPASPPPAPVSPSPPPSSLGQTTGTSPLGQSTGKCFSALPPFEVTLPLMK